MERAEADVFKGIELAAVLFEGDEDIKRANELMVMVAFACETAQVFAATGGATKDEILEVQDQTAPAMIELADKLLKAFEQLFDARELRSMLPKEDRTEENAKALEARGANRLATLCRPPKTIKPAY